MTQNIKQFIEEGEKSIEKLAKNYANASYLVSEESHDEIEEIQALKQLKQFISSRQISLIKMIVERMKEEIWAYHKLNNEWLKKYNVSEELEKELNEMFMHSHNEPLDTISSKLKELTDGK